MVWFMFERYKTKYSVNMMKYLFGVIWAKVRSKDQFRITLTIVAVPLAATFVSLNCGIHYARNK